MDDIKKTNYDERQIIDIQSLFNASNIADDNDLPDLIDRLNKTGIDPSLLTLKDFGLEGLTDNGNEDTTIEEDIDILSNKCQDSTLQLYLKDVRDITKQYGLLSREQEIELAKKIKKGNNSAKQTLINSNLRLVIKYAKKFCGQGVAAEDLIQEGNLGLCMAADKYDYKKGFRFSTYATWWILQRIRRLMVSRYNIISVPTHVYYKAKTISNVIAEFQLEHGRTPTTQEIAEITKLPIRTIETTMKVPSHMINIESNIDNDCNTTFGDILSDPNEKNIEDTVANNLIKDNIKDKLYLLSEREREVVEKYFFQGKSLQEIGNEMGRTRERIRQIKEDALYKLRKDESLKVYLEDL